MGWILTVQSRSNEAPHSSLLRRSRRFGCEGRKLRGIRRKRIDRQEIVTGCLSDSLIRRDAGGERPGRDFTSPWSAQKRSPSSRSKINRTRLNRLIADQHTGEIEQIQPSSARRVVISFTLLCTCVTERQRTRLSVAKPLAHRGGQIRGEERHCHAGASPVPLSSG